MCFTYERRYRDKIQAALLDWAGTSARGGRVLSPKVAPGVTRPVLVSRS